MIGVAHVLKVIASLKSIALNVIEALKGGINLGDLPKIFKLLIDIKDLVDNVPAALPELTDLDSTEAGLVATAAYDLVKSVIAGLGAK